VASYVYEGIMRNEFLIFLIVYITSLSATIINIPADQPSIQVGIDFAVDADTVLVQPGIYYENINFNGKNITVASLMLTTNDPYYIQSTIIDADESGRVVTFENNEDSTAVLSGFTIRNGCLSTQNLWQLYGGGIYCYNSSPTLTNLHITTNYISSAYEASGGGICFRNSYSKISNSTISYNLSSWVGGGIAIYDGCVTISACKIISNYYSGIEVFGAGCTVIDNSIIKYHYTAIGIGIGTNNMILTRCFITENLQAFSCSGGYYTPINITFRNLTITNNTTLWSGSYYGNYNLQIHNSILWNNTDSEIEVPEESEITVAYSDIEGGVSSITGNGVINWLEGNIYVNPLFEDNSTCYLSIDSPCIDAGDPNSPLDPDGTIADMGCFYFDQIIGINDNEIPSAIYNLTNYPNPFNPSTTIEFSIQNDSRVELSVYNIKGQKIKTLVNDNLTYGNYSINWNGTNERNESVSSGIYFYNLIVKKKQISTGKCILIK